MCWGAVPAPQASVVGRRLQGREQRQGLGGEGFRMERGALERGARRTSAQSCSRGGADVKWAEELTKEGKKADWHELLPARGFHVLPRRRVVERSFAWIDHNRRMSLGTTRGGVRAAKRSYMLA